MARNDGGIGKADPWPTNDTPIHEQNPSPHQSDGYHNRGPGGAHYEPGSEYWLDCLVYPERPEVSNEGVGRADMASRMYQVSVGNVTGKKPGPTPD